MVATVAVSVFIGFVGGFGVGWYFACMGVRAMLERGELKRTPKWHASGMK